jgi:hypothetical protein
MILEFYSMIRDGLGPNMFWSESVMVVENEGECNLGVRIFLAPGPQHDFAQLHPSAPKLLLPGHRPSLPVDFAGTSEKCRFLLPELETPQRKQ